MPTGRRPPADRRALLMASSTSPLSTFLIFPRLAGREANPPSKQILDVLSLP